MAKYDFREVSSRKCSKCGKPLKKKIVENNDATMCYKHYVQSKGLQGSRECHQS